MTFLEKLVFTRKYDFHHACSKCIMLPEAVPGGFYKKHVLKKI